MTPINGSMSVDTGGSFGGIQVRVTNPADGQTIIRSGGVWVNSNSNAVLDPTTTEGDMIYKHTGQLARFGVGAADTFLGSDGTDPTYLAFNKSTNFIGNGRSVIFDLSDSGVSAYTENFGTQESIDSKGRIIASANLDNTTLSGGASPFSTSYVGSFSSSQNIPTGVGGATLVFSTPLGGYFNSLPSWCNTGTGVFTIPTTGFYVFKGSMTTGTTGGTFRAISVLATTSNPVASNKLIDYAAIPIPTTSFNGNFGVNCGRAYRFTAGDTVTFFGQHDIGTTTTFSTYVSVEAICRSSP